jgi:hypothetical protein
MEATTPPPRQRPKTQTTRPKPRRAGQLSSFQLMFAVILAIGLILTINFSTRITAGRPLLEAYETIKNEITLLEQEQQRLLTQQDFAQNDYYVEQWARDRGKMVRSGERLVIPVPSASTVVITPVAVDFAAFDPGFDEPENWELWWLMFFDDPPPRFDGE